MDTYSKKLLRKAVVLAFGLVGITSASAIIVDDFRQGAPVLLEATNYSPAQVDLQTGLSTNSTIGGTRRVTAQTQGFARSKVEPLDGKFTFEALSDFGYFTLEYGTEAPLEIDLRADGSDAFLLKFTEVSTPGLWRGGYSLRVNGTHYDLLKELAAGNGPRTFRIPFSKFSTNATFIANQISLSATRVEQSYRLILDSIVTIKTPPPLKMMLSNTNLQLSWSTNGAGVLESAVALDAATWNPVTHPISAGDEEFTVTFPLTNTSRYFRLRNQ